MAAEPGESLVFEGVSPRPVLTWATDGPWQVDGDLSPGVDVERFAPQGLTPAAGRSAFRIGKLAEPPTATWDLQLRGPTAGTVREGDRLLARFWMRCDDSMTGQAYTQLAFERATTNYDKSVLIELTTGREWKRFDVAFEAHDDFAPGEAQLVLQLGFGRQRVEVAGASLWNYGKALEVDDLPSVDLSYEGRALDAPWRQAAAERIEKLRKGDLVVTVRDAQGNPMPGAQVSVELTRHAFPFGTAVAVGGLVGQSADDQRYREVLKNNFNYFVFENAMKWNNHNIGTPEQIDAALDWLEANGIPGRGHVLVWPSWIYIPEHIEALASNPERLRAAVNARVTDTATRYRGRLTDWDVINETVANTDLMEVLGYEEMTEWFKLARKADPDAGLFLNDYAILSGGARDTGHQNRYYELLQGLIDQGAPMTGIGMQGHFGSNLTAPERLWEILDRFSAFGLPIRVTEFDIDIRDEQLQADYMRDFLTAMFSHPSVDGVLIWGFWENRHWRARAALYRADWSIRPQGQAWRDLVYGQWKTEETVAAGDDGSAAFRGFKGDYRVVVRHNGDTQTATIAIGSDPSTLELTLP
ncbi:MAG: endo-1,4-beta-xylanase [Planctomycetota bacterium]